MSDNKVSRDRFEDLVCQAEYLWGVTILYHRDRDKFITYLAGGQDMISMPTGPFYREMTELGQSQAPAEFWQQVREIKNLFSSRDMISIDEIAGKCPFLEILAYNEP